MKFRLQRRGLHGRSVARYPCAVREKARAGHSLQPSSRPTRGRTMPVAPQDRPLASVREETIDQLIVNYGHGKLSLEAFERRLDQALDAKSADALLALTTDLPLKADKAYAKAK